MAIAVTAAAQEPQVRARKPNVFALLPKSNLIVFGVENTKALHVSSLRLLAQHD
jgi:hypothetical protein